jgi:uncharacterized protein YjbI with pentapeptide repeats
MADAAGSAAERAQARIDAVRTGLAAGAGVGAAVGLMLAFRRQRHQEIATALTNFDATERRITELYTKAVEQLGSTKAPVRLGGLYALERLAQGNPDHRQTIVDVICAYLRIPHTPAPDEDSPTDQQSEVLTQDVPEMRQERHVRLAAQRLLTDHLRPQPYENIDHSIRSNSRFWDEIRLDLAGAVLIDFDLSACHVTDSRFTDAVLTGHCSFEDTVFYGETNFGGTAFPDFANFTDATFHGKVWFGRASFQGEPGAGTAEFHDNAYSRRGAFNGATFRRTTFHALAVFRSVIFRGDVRFDAAIFSDRCIFSGTFFHGNVRFNQVRFQRSAYFGEEDFEVNFYPAATFCQLVQFDEAVVTGNGKVLLEGAKVHDETAAHIWPPGWTMCPEEDGTGTLTEASPQQT